MAKTGDDCYFFYNQTCMKGETCPFRHVEEAKSSTVTCDKWRMNMCNTIPCPLRHMELQQNVPCFYETQPGGCTKPNCSFRHKFSKQQVAPQAPVPVSVAPIPGRNILHQPPVSGPVPVIYNRPPPPRPGWQGAGIPAVQMFQGPPISRPLRPIPPAYPPFLPAASLPPAHVPVMQVEPVIINPNEESDQDSIKGSPMKAVTRGQSVVPPHTQIQSHNPLDYFLNAKPWVDTSQRNVFRRSPSPGSKRSRSKSPRRSLSPRRSVSPRRSPSPNFVSRQRSVSAERYSSGVRRRSGSLDRSRSPDWRDSRRFSRRPSRSPPRRRSRSPNRDRDRGILNRYRQGGRGRKLQEVKVTGSKIISIKKDRKQEKEEEEEEDKEKKEEKVETVKSDRSKAVADIVKEDVKSLEDIYRERALQSLMDAKRKKILENKRKRWENVESKKVSESEKSDKSGKQSADDEDQSNVDEKGDNKNEDVDSSSDSADEGGDNKSDIDLPDDIDIELGEGELESDNESEKSEVTSDKEDEHEEELPVKQKSKIKGSVSIPAKPSIKSRLGHKPLGANPERKVQENARAIVHKRSVKDRLGIKDRLGQKTNPVTDNSVRSNKSSRASAILSRLHPDLKERKRTGKNILMLPQITIKNESDIESRKAGIFQRLGLHDDEENDSDSKKERRKKRGIDEELMKLLREEEAEIDEEDLELLSKKEKKKLLKRLLAQQGREEEYDMIKKKRKKGFKKKREYKDLDEDGESKRRINVQNQEDKDKEEDADLEDLQSEEEIQLEEETEHTEEPVREERIVKSSEDIQREKEQKEIKLREALEPKSLEDIRKERALKKSQPGDARIKIAQAQNKRKIVVEEDQPPKVSERPVHITFHGMESAPKRKLIRLGKEQIENHQPVESKAGRGLKRERQIYVPPTVKRTAPEEPVAALRVAGPPKGREIVHYGDMFSKKPTAAVEEKKTTVKLTKSASESVIRPRLQLNKGPPKVEVKDATVKTFAEIMAEKKRKRLLAQQGKTFTPIAFDDNESSQGSIPDDRLSPIPSQFTVSSININSPVKTSPVKLSLSRPASATNIDKIETKSRWKRRKMSNPDVPVPEKRITDTQEKKYESTKDSKLSNESDIFVEKISEKVDESGFDEEFTSQKSVSPVKAESSISFEERKKSTEEKKRLLSESFMDFDDDLLNMDDDDDIDLNLEGGGKDTDELMREIDEMLA